MAEYLEGKQSFCPRTLSLRRVSRIWRWQVKMPSKLVLGAGLLGLVVILAIAAPLLSPWDPAQQSLAWRLRPPAWVEGGSMQHPLGTDNLGRDVLARILYGMRVSCEVGFIAVVVSAVVGSLLGLVAGYWGGLQDTIIMRITDIFLAVPLLLLAITVIAVLGTGLNKLILVIAFTRWMVYARCVRGETLKVKQQAFVEGARAVGAKTFRILFRYILPHCLPSIAVLATLNLSNVIMIESGLSYLGLGVQPPMPSLGNMLSEGRLYIATAWWLSVFPGLAMMIMFLGANFLADGLRELWGQK